MPWWAVSASIIATVISSVTFIAVPAAVFKPGGNLGYFQVLLGLMLGKVLTAVVFAGPYYESSSIRTTYDYIGARLHPAVGRFSIGLGIALSVVTTSIKVLTNRLKKPTERKLPLQAFKAACKLFSCERLIESILMRRRLRKRRSVSLAFE